MANHVVREISCDVIMVAITKISMQHAQSHTMHVFMVIARAVVWLKDFEHHGPPHPWI